jgi:hypothetical protein
VLVEIKEQSDHYGSSNEKVLLGSVDLLMQKLLT